MVFRDLKASPNSPYKKTNYVVEVTGEYEAHYGAESPGADIMYRIHKQRVPLESNGYYVKAKLKGTIVGRGYYGGEVGIEGEYLFMPYAYEADSWVSGEKKPYNPYRIVKK